MKYKIGDIVTLKSHPLLYNLRIKGDGKLVPPFMIVKNIKVDSPNKKLKCEELDLKIAERIKYTCVWFDDNRTEFKEAIFYESMLKSYKKIYIERKDGKLEEKPLDYLSLIDEVDNYKVPKYKFGKVVCFRTKKFEIFKKRDSIKFVTKRNKRKEIVTVTNIVNFSSPDFVLCGAKRNERTNQLFENGDSKQIESEILFKVKWFNSFQMKFSDIYLPAEFFTTEKKNLKI